MQQKKEKLAVLIDEYGGVSGMVTLEDLIEVIVGDIHEEYEEVEQEVIAGCFRIVAMSHTLFQHQLAFQSFLNSCCQSQTAVVRLHSSTGQNRITTLLQCLSHQKF